METICLAHIRIDRRRRLEFDRLYSVWKWERETREVPPNGFLLSIGLPVPLDHVPGQLEYRAIEDEFLDVSLAFKPDSVHPDLGGRRTGTTPNYARTAHRDSLWRINKLIPRNVIVKSG